MAVPEVSLSVVRVRGWGRTSRCQILMSVAILMVQRLMVIDADSDKKNGQLQGIIECWPTEADRRKKNLPVQGLV